MVTNLDRAPWEFCLKARAFSYARPSTVEEALQAFASAGEDASYIAGGQSLVPALALRLQAPQLLVDIAHISSLRGVAMQDGWLRIGALTRHCEVMTDPLIAQHAPLFREAAPHVAHPAIRNKGTLGGSIAHADPASEFPAVAMAAGAEFEIANLEGTRRVPADEFFVDLFQTAIEPGELLVAIHVPPVRPGQCWAFDEIARRRGDFALAGCGILAGFQDNAVEEIRIAFFGVGSTPVRAKTAEAALTGCTLDRDAVIAAQAAVGDDLEPPEDDHTPPAMRVQLARVLLGRLLGRLMERA